MGKAGAKMNNLNAEVWTFETAKEFMIKSFEISNNSSYDFIGEVAKEMGSYKEVYAYLSNKFPELEVYKKTIKSNCEVNCFSNAKKGDIVSSVAIINLKANHDWTDRVDSTTDGDKISSSSTTVINFKNKR